MIKTDALVIGAGPVGLFVVHQLGIIGLKSEVLAKALTIAQSLRPERYTILSEVDMTEKKAISLAKSTKVL